MPEVFQAFDPLSQEFMADPYPVLGQARRLRG
jgi:hypothetical protein